MHGNKMVTWQLLCCAAVIHLSVAVHSMPGCTRTFSARSEGARKCTCDDHDDCFHDVFTECAPLDAEFGKVWVRELLSGCVCMDEFASLFIC
jgi:hypothetical protein